MRVSSWDAKGEASQRSSCTVRTTDRLYWAHIFDGIDVDDLRVTTIMSVDQRFFIARSFASHASRCSLRLPKYTDKGAMRFFFFVCALVSTLTSPVAAQFLCNICGCEGCTYGYSRGVVNFVFQGKAEKVDCLQLQQQVENPTIFGTEFCRTVIWKAAVEPCKCYDPQYPDYLLEEIPGECRTHENDCVVIHTKPLSQI